MRQFVEQVIEKINRTICGESYRAIYGIIGHFGGELKGDLGVMEQFVEATS